MWSIMKSKSVCLSPTFREELMLRDQHPFPPFANVPRGKISERRDTWILGEFCAAAIRISSPKADLGNHCLADHPQRKQQRADSVFEAVDLSINKQSLPSMPNPDPTRRKEGWEEESHMWFSYNRAGYRVNGKYRKVKDLGFVLQAGVVARTRKEWTFFKILKKKENYND